MAKLDSQYCPTHDIYSNNDSSETRVPCPADSTQLVGFIIYFGDIWEY